MTNSNEGTTIAGEVCTESIAQSRVDYCTYYYNICIEPVCTHQPLPESEFQSFWTHIELGAGNYGLDGHTKVSQQMTVLMELKFVSGATNYVDGLPEHDKHYDVEHKYNPDHQFALLFETIDQLVSKKGTQGIFHVNDLFPEYAEYAAEQLKQYAASKGYHDIIIEVVSGDYTKIFPSQTIGKYGKPLYDSAHLKNPEVSLYNYGMDGDKMLSNVESRESARVKLQTLANLSYNGLYFFPIYNSSHFIPAAEKEEFIKKGIFYHTTTEYSPVPYYFPEGPIIKDTYGAVYWINVNYTC